MEVLYDIKVLRPEMALRLLPAEPPSRRERVADAVAFMGLFALRALLTVFLCLLAVIALLLAGVPQLAPLAGMLIGFMVFA